MSCSALCNLCNFLLTLASLSASLIFVMTKETAIQILRRRIKQYSEESASLEWIRSKEGKDYRRFMKAIETVIKASK